MKKKNNALVTYPPTRKSNKYIFINGENRNIKFQKQIKTIQICDEQDEKRCRCDFIGWATERRLLTGAIPLLPDTGTFGCSVSLLARFAPP
jgi:hypothetical protein